MIRMYGFSGPSPLITSTSNYAKFRPVSGDIPLDTSGVGLYRFAHWLGPLAQGESATFTR